MTITSLLPRQPVPGLDVALTRGGRYTLGQQPGEHFDLLVFYRGLHCPICASYLTEFERLAPEIKKRGVRCVAISADPEDRARQMADKVKAESIEIAYGLALEKAREWGLYISTTRGNTSVGIDEPEHFSEPGLFLVKPDATLYYAAVQTMPFARPSFEDLMAGIDFAVSKNYPARGEYTGPV